MKAKPDFSTIYYDRGHVCWGKGNSAVSLKLLARIKISENTPKQDREEKKDYEQAKAIYDKYINKGVRFKSSGKLATGVTARITHINFQKQTVSWKQDNMTAKQKHEGYKAAAGKFLINSMISLYRSKNIEFMEP